MSRVFWSFLCLAALLGPSLCNCSDSAAQSSLGGVTASGSNFLRFGEGSSGDPTKNDHRRYLEEIANTRLFWKNLSIGLRYEYDDSSEVGASYQGIRRRWVTYRDEDVLLQAGDYSALFGRGLTLNLFESRALNFDTWLDGFYGEYGKDWKKSEIDWRPSFAIKALAGKLDFRDILVTDLNRPSLHLSTRGANGEFGIWGKKLKVGLSFVQSQADRQEFTGSAFAGTDRLVEQPGAYIGFFTGDFEGFWEWSEERSHLSQIAGVPVDVSHKGSALYGAVSYANSEFSITTEYKNYHYDLTQPNSEFSGYFGKLPITNPPEVYKDHTYTSITRTTHAVNFNDEIGMEAEVTVTAIPDFVVTLNGAAASRHQAYDRAGNVTGETGIFPEFDSLSYWPFWEGFAEVEYTFGELNYIKAAYHRRMNVIVYSPFTRTDFKRTTTVAAKLQYATSDNQSLLAIAEHQWEYDAAEGPDHFTALNELLTLQYSINPVITFGGVLDFSTRYDKPRHIWPQGFASVRINGGNNLLVSYGAERGGLNCTGGICRQVPAFSGVRITLTSQF